MNISAFDGRQLPQNWLTYPYKNHVIAWLQGNGGVTKPAMWEQSLMRTDRIRVLNHLRAVGSINQTQWVMHMQGLMRTSIEYADAIHEKMERRRLEQQMESRLYRPAFKSPIVRMEMDFTATEKRIQEWAEANGGHAYPSPNGGNRILPSVYTTLTDIWVRSNGQQVRPQDMNMGHLENTIKLLTESYNNVQARSQLLLGKMDGHFRHEAKVTKALRATCLDMQKVTIEQMYPIIEVLRKELASRRPPMEFIFDLETTCLDWGDR